MNMLLPLIIGIAFFSAPPAPPAQPSPPAAQSENPDPANAVDRWMVYQYLLGGGERAPEMVAQYLAGSIKDIKDDDDQEHAVTLMIIFLGQLGHQHPELLDAWTQASTAMSPRAQYVFAYAIWMADPGHSDKRVAKIVEAMSGDDEHLNIDIIAKLPDQDPPDFKSFKPSDGATLDYWWVSFMATGDTEYVGRILTALPPHKHTFEEFDPGDDFIALAVASSAIWSLTSNAYQHPVILKYLKQQRKAEDGPWPILDKIISDAEAKLEESPSPAPTP